MDQPDKKTTDRRVKKTKSAIYNSFRKLLAEKKYSEITVKELTEEADITRKTFYLHYGTLDDVLREYLANRLVNVQKEIENSNLSEDANDFNQLFFALSQTLGQERINMAKLMEDARSRQIAYQLLTEQQEKRWKENAKRYELTEQVARLYGTYSTYGFISMFMRWYTDSDTMPSEEFAELTRDIMAEQRKLLKKWGGQSKADDD